MRCEFNVRPLGQSQCQAQKGSGEWGMGIKKRRAITPRPSRAIASRPSAPTPHSLLPPRSLWPPACVLVKTDATRRQYDYCETETGRQEEHQEGAGGVARNVVERTL